MHVDSARDAKKQENNAWEQFKVLKPLKERSISKALVSTMWVITWKMADGKKSVRARLVAKGYLDPNSKEGNVGTSGCVSLR